MLLSVISWGTVSDSYLVLNFITVFFFFLACICLFDVECSFAVEWCIDEVCSFAVVCSFDALCLHVVCSSAVVCFFAIACLLFFLKMSKSTICPQVMFYEVHFCLPQTGINAAQNFFFFFLLCLLCVWQICLKSPKQKRMTVRLCTGCKSQHQVKKKKN